MPNPMPLNVNEKSTKRNMLFVPFFILVDSSDVHANGVINHAIWAMKRDVIQIAQEHDVPVRFSTHFFDSIFGSPSEKSSLSLNELCKRLDGNLTFLMEAYKKSTTNISGGEKVRLIQYDPLPYLPILILICSNTVNDVTIFDDLRKNVLFQNSIRFTFSFSGCKAKELGIFCGSDEGHFICTLSEFETYLKEIAVCCVEHSVMHFVVCNDEMPRDYKKL